MLEERAWKTGIVVGVVAALLTTWQLQRLLTDEEPENVEEQRMKNRIEQKT